MPPDISTAFSLPLLIEHEWYHACPLLPTRDFVSFCGARGLHVTDRWLAVLDELDILKPVAVARQRCMSEAQAWGDKEDQEPTDRDNDAALHRYSLPFYRQVEVQDWFDAGDLWDRNEEAFDPWYDVFTRSGDPHIDRYYSPFQCYALWHIFRIGDGRYRMLPGHWVLGDDEARAKILAELPRKFESEVDGWRIRARNAEAVWQVCQAISNRYHAYTRGDRRIFQLSVPAAWDWDEFRRTWDPQRVLGELDLTAQDLFRLWGSVEGDVQVHDPLKSWHDLISFIDPQQRSFLRGDAQLGQLFHAMETMLRLFYSEITGTHVYPTYDRPGQIDQIYGDGTEHDELSMLDFVTNKYNLSPRPRVILAVEGKGEFEQFQRICLARYNFPLARPGIEIINLRGYHNFEGSSRDRLSAWFRFIDYHHHHHTLVFIVLDPHGRVTKLREDLARAPSHHDENRAIHRKDCFHIWDNSVEFDSFSDGEIARAMTGLAGGRHVFDEGAIAECRERNRTSKKDELSHLYHETFEGAYDLDKPRCLEILVGYALAQSKQPPELGDPQQDRAIIQVLNRVVSLAMWNHPPVGTRIRTSNLEAGAYGMILSQVEGLS